MRSRPARSPTYPTAAVKAERLKARHISYVACNDFENCMLMADDLRISDKNSREAQMLENAAWAVRRAEKVMWLKTRSIR